MCYKTKKKKKKNQIYIDEMIFYFDKETHKNQTEKVTTIMNCINLYYIDK